MLILAQLCVILTIALSFNFLKQVVSQLKEEC
jgi:hypothetical protein